MCNESLYDSVDKIVQGNTSNIVFLKSTDDSMLDTLQKMSGTTHKSYINSKTVTRDLERIFLPNEGKLSYTMQTQEMPVISYNDMAFLPERNSIVFRAGDFPIWNRNETILPMSWRLMKNAIKDPGHEYSLQTIPTLSSALDFDVRKNQPDFQKMLEKRMDQALVADEAKECYQKAYGYSDYDVSQLDADNYSMTIMEIVNRYLKQRKSDYADDNTNVDENEMMCLWDNVEENTEQLEENAKQQKEYDKKFAGGYYAGGILTRADLIGNGVIAHARDPEIITAFTEVRGDMERDPSFTFKNGELWSADGTKPYITRNKDVSKNLDAINKAMKDGETLTYGDHEITEEELSEFNSWTVTDDFYRFLVSMDTWDFAKGRFEQAMSRLMHD